MRKLKVAILKRLAEAGRDALREVIDGLEVEGVDRRKIDAMSRALSRSRRATPAVLLNYLREGEVKDICDNLGVPSKGRKRQLIERLLTDTQTNSQSPAKAARKTTERRTTTMAKATRTADSYRHPEATNLMRPEVGTQAQFRKRKPPATYRYDSSLSPALDWDGQNTARDLGEWLIAQIEEASRLEPPHQFPQPREFRGAGGQVLQRIGGLRDAVEALRRLSQPFLNWAGKAERLTFDVPTLPLFVHERLSTKAILETLTGHRKPADRQLELFGDPQHSIADQVLKAYEYPDKWVNRLILGDSLVVMNSLVHYEGLAGQVQMIYMDPPYGVRFGQNFQPFVRKRGSPGDNDDPHATREPEMVQAYRDTWELGLHSYLTYLRDRLLLCRELLHPTGSVFVQISDDNLNHVLELLDETFGEENRCAVIAFKKTGFASSEGLSTTHDFLLWYARSISRLRERTIFGERELTQAELNFYDQIELMDGTRRPLTKEERRLGSRVRQVGRVFARNPMVSPGWQDSLGYEVEFAGKRFRPPSNRHWATHEEGMNRLKAARRLAVKGKTLRFVRYFDDFALQPLGTVWSDTGVGGFVGDERLYVVQTDKRVVERCILMTTDPGDLVLDPTCGSGTTAYVAEQWGRRWITIDCSRVPLALARQRLLTATYRWHELKDESRGPISGFVYERKQNSKGEEVGGIVPHIKLESIANNEPTKEEVLVDRPKTLRGITRVTGPFCVEATIPTPVDWDGQDGPSPQPSPTRGERATVAVEPASADAQLSTSGSQLSATDRMLEILRKSPVLRLGGKREVRLKQVRRPTKTLSLSAEAMVDAPSPPTPLPQGERADGSPVAFVFGPENGAVSEKLVFEAAREAHAKGYAHLYVVGFAIQPNARGLIQTCDAVVGIPATYVQSTPDLMMGDLLKNMRSSQIFSVCGLPEIKVHPGGRATKKNGVRYQVELLGLDVFDPVTMETDHRRGDDVPAWFLDTDYNGLCFHVCQAFFPRTAAWDKLKRALRGTHDESVWDHLAGTKSAPFEPGEHRQVAVKVIDDRGNELMVVERLKG